MALAAVITGDIVNSTKLPPGKLSRLKERIKKILYAGKYEFYRGDSFQALVTDTDSALKMVLQIRLSAKAIGGDSDVKASLGIGQARQNIKNLHEATDDAFIISGRGLDEISNSGARLVINSSSGFLHPTLHVIGEFIDFIFRDITQKQAEVLLELLEEKTQSGAAKKLGKSVSTINKHLQAAGWNDLQKLITTYKQVIHSTGKPHGN